MSKGFSLDDYVDVAERVREFYERYPDGRLCAGSVPAVMEIGERVFIWYHAQAFRSPEDPLPGDGWAAEPIPGSTTYTRDSELMNAETSAWGRAIAACGLASKKIASAQEVRARIEDKPILDEASLRREAVSMVVEVITEGQRRLVWARAKERGMGAEHLHDVVYAVCQVNSISEVPRDALDDLLATIAAWEAS